MKNSSTVFGLSLAAALGMSQAAGAVDVAYLVSTMGSQGANDGSAVSRVVLDPVTSRGNLFPLVHLAEYDHVDVAAVTPDGNTMYWIDSWVYPSPQTLGWVNLLDNSYGAVGVIWTAGGEAFEPDQGAFTPDGRFIAANNRNDSIYEVNLLTAEAVRIGPVKIAGGVTVDIQGGDIAIADDGTLYIWTNRVRSGAPAGLYRATAFPPVGPDVLVDFLGSGGDGDHFFTGAAFYADGSIIASNRSYQFHTQNPVDGSDLGVYWMYLNGAPYYDHNYGDMASGPFPSAACTYTIGYWKNHSWDGVMLSVNGQSVDEGLGKSILSNAKGNNWSMFFSQLIAAKLNCATCSVVLEADAFLATQSVTSWYQAFADGAQKAAANAHKDALDAFNNSNHCN